MNAATGSTTSVEVEEVDPDELVGAARAAAWARRLEKQLDLRAPKITLLRDYRRSRHPIKFATDEWRETFGEDFGPVVDNWMALVAEAPVERMTVLGFRFGRAPKNADHRPDEPAWKLWQENLLDLESELAHDDAVTTGYSYVLTWPDEADKSRPLITVEDPLHAIVERDPANRRRRRAGMKRWRALNGAWHAQVWTPETTWLLKKGKDGWQADDGGSVNPLRRVPLVPLVNSPDVYGEGYGDFEGVLALQDAANKLFSDMLIASEFAAFVQRVLIGAEIPTDDDGNPMEELRGGLARWIGIEVDGDPGDGRPLEPKIVELRASNLENYIKPIQEIVLHIAAQTKTPASYILGQLVNISADAIRATEAALVKRVRRKMRLFGEAWEEALRLAFMLLGDTERAEDLGAEIVWDDPETISESQRVDAIVKLKDVGVPEEALWEMVPGSTPRRIARWREMRERQAVVTGITLGVAPNGAVPEPAAEREAEPIAA